MAKKKKREAPGWHWPMGALDFYPEMNAVDKIFDRLHAKADKALQKEVKAIVKHTMRENFPMLTVQDNGKIRLYSYDEGFDHTQKFDFGDFLCGGIEDDNEAGVRASANILRAAIDAAEAKALKLLK